MQVIESEPSVAARAADLATRLTVRPVFTAFSHVPHLPWPWGALEQAARVFLPAATGIRAAVRLPNASALLIRADGVAPADGTGKVILYLHGGAFLGCGAHSHGRLLDFLSRYADAPVLAVNYRLLPKHSIGMAIDDCHDGYRWLQQRGYQPHQVVLAGDSAGGYLALSLAQRLKHEGEDPAAAVVAMSPLLQLSAHAKQAHPNAKTDPMLPAKAFDALYTLMSRAAAVRATADGRPEELYEPLEHIEPGLPPTLIHVSGSEVLLHDAQLAAQKLAAAGIPTEIRVWPGQIHAFQIAAPLVPEAIRSLRQIGEYIKDACEAQWPAASAV